MRPHRWQPTRFPHPWDSLGKNTGVGCHFLLQCMKVKSKSEVTQSCPTLSDPMDCRGLLHPWDFPGKSAGVGCHCLLLNNPTMASKCLSERKSQRMRQNSLLSNFKELPWLPQHSATTPHPSSQQSSTLRQDPPPAKR